MSRGKRNVLSKRFGSKVKPSKQQIEQNSYQTAWCHIPEDGTLYSHFCEYLRIYNYKHGNDVKVYVRVLLIFSIFSSIGSEHVSQQIASSTQ
jgi:hypothetical protein